MVLMLKLLQLQNLTASDLEDRAKRARNLRERSERKVSSMYVCIYIYILEDCACSAHAFSSALRTGSLHDHQKD